ncbi:hypothetical protein BDA99DRAFT_538410 [Phascolomyces articulosus]|uniref:Mannosyltransferase n=1 Tax=Phascolomyces articulosus TaxID=60185 RepID=A0AAD5JXZ9_9FUNG|nr:hypothetical protein BDA99DRAFT_538410 [Phascolomyces articulosus]
MIQQKRFNSKDQHKLQKRNIPSSSKQNNDNDIDTIPEITKPIAAATKGDQRSTTGSRLFVFSLCLVFRLLNAYFTRTFDNPDEYWQSQEIAHNMVFGYPFFIYMI